MGAPLNTVAVVVRMLGQIWKKPIIPVNHCVARAPNLPSRFSLVYHFACASHLPS